VVVVVIVLGGPCANEQVVSASVNKTVILYKRNKTAIL